ncbi:MAG: hypothetical protein J6M31_01795 [Bacteroidales bacterium]|nr:hypothetical protein [Bacteroidales bacterium]
MTPEERLRRNIMAVVGPAPITVYQGIVSRVDGITCTVRFGEMEVDGIRLRASEASQDAQMLIVPKVDTAVIVGSLSGDLSELVVLAVDVIERIEINGGQLGGLINIEALTDKLNELVNAFNNHTHTILSGKIKCGPYPNAAPVQVPAVTSKAQQLKKSDYEDETVKH